MRFLCVLQDTECVKCQNEDEAKRVILDWLTDGHVKDDIEVFRWGPPFAYQVETTHKVTIVK